MSLRKHVKAIGGLAALLVLLGLLIADTVQSGVVLSVQDKAILLTLIGTLLGLDQLLEQVPGITIGTDRGRDDE